MSFPPNFPPFTPLTFTDSHHNLTYDIRQYAPEREVPKDALDDFLSNELGGFGPAPVLVKSRSGEEFIIEESSSDDEMSEADFTDRVFDPTAADEKVDEILKNKLSETPGEHGSLEIVGSLNTKISEPHVVKRFIDFLNQNASAGQKVVTEIQFNQCSFTESAWKSLIDGLSTLKNISELAFFDCQLTDKQLEYLLGLKGQLKFLGISHNDSYSLIDRISSFADNNPQLEELLLESIAIKKTVTPVDPLPLAKLVEALQSASKFKSLSLTRSELDDVMAQPLIDLAQKHPHLEVLDLEGNKLGAFGDSNSVIFLKQIEKVLNTRALEIEQETDSNLKPALISLHLNGNQMRNVDEKEWLAFIKEGANGLKELSLPFVSNPLPMIESAKGTALKTLHLTTHTTNDLESRLQNKTDSIQKSNGRWLCKVGNLTIVISQPVKTHHHKEPVRIEESVKLQKRIFNMLHRPEGQCTYYELEKLLRQSGNEVVIEGTKGLTITSILNVLSLTGGLAKEQLESLFLINCNFAEEAWNALFSDLKKTLKIKKLIFNQRDCPLPAARMKNIATLKESLTSLAFFSQEFTKEHVSHLMELFRSNNKLDYFELDQMKVESEGVVAALAVGLQSAENLRELSINATKLTSEALEPVFELIASHPKLEKIYLTDIGLNDEHLEHLIAALGKRKKNNFSKISLCLSNNALSAEACQNLYEKTKGILKAFVMPEANNLLAFVNSQEQTELITIVKPSFPIAQLTAFLKQYSPTTSKPSKDWLDLKFNNQTQTIRLAENAFYEIIAKAFQEAKEPTQELLDFITLLNDSHPKEALFATLLEKQFELARIAGDGNCLFSSFLEIYPEIAENFSEPKHLRPDLLRQCTADLIIDHSQEFQDSISFQDMPAHTNEEFFNSLSPKERLENYCLNMKWSREWGGNHELIALGKLVTTRTLPGFTILDLSMSPEIKEGKFVPLNFLTFGSPLDLGNGQFSPLRSLHRVGQVHYNALLPKKTPAVNSPDVLIEGSNIKTLETSGSPKHAFGELSLLQNKSQSN